MTEFAPEDFNFIAGLLKDRSGLALTPDKGYLLETRLLPIAKAHGLADTKALIARLRAAPPASLVNEVVESMTTNESMFFRDTKPFEHLTKLILPALKATGRNTLRIWSAACSTGQEPYSIAMTIKEEISKYPGLKVEIYATDLAEKVLERAKAGTFSQFEVQRGLPITMLVKYFTQLPNNTWQINDDVRTMVTYAPANLLTSFASLGKFDIIFCRNVLIYFDEKTKTDVLERMAAILHPPGYVFLGGAESTLGLTKKFIAVPDHRGLFALAV